MTLAPKTFEARSTGHARVSATHDLIARVSCLKLDHGAQQAVQEGFYYVTEQWLD